MENTFVHNSSIHYKVRATENMNSLDISLHVNDGKSESRYGLVLVNGALSR